MLAVDRLSGSPWRRTRVLHTSWYVRINSTSCPEIGAFLFSALERRLNRKMAFSRNKTLLFFYPPDNGSRISGWYFHKT